MTPLVSISAPPTVIASTAILSSCSVTKAAMPVLPMVDATVRQPMVHPSAARRRLQNCFQCLPSEVEEPRTCLLVMFEPGPAPGQDHVSC